MKRFYIICLLLLPGLMSFAQDVTEQEAVDASLRLMDSFFPEGRRSIEKIESQKAEEGILFYLVDLEPEGWVMVSGDKRTEPVLGFSFTGEYTIAVNDPNNPQYLWIKAYEDQITDIKNGTFDKQHQGWSEDYYSTTLKSSTADKVSVNPLIDATWNQGTGWNIYCPADEEGPGGHTWVGCVAVAMAQAMSVFNYPSTGTGYYSYTQSPYGTLAVNFGEASYLWNQMSMTQADNNNALILYHSAVSVDMDFGPDGSGTLTSYASSALKSYFNYSKNIVYKRRSAYEATWKEMLIAELVAGRPLIYKGDADDGQPGHAWNIDGVVNSNYFHVNWGWSGSNNGYYLIDNLKPGSYDFTQNHAAIFNIQPYYYPTDIILSSTVVPEEEAPGAFVGKIGVVDEATDNVYEIKLVSDSTFTGGEWIYDYYLENDSLKTGRYYPAGEIIKDTVGFILTDAHNNRLEVEIILSFETTTGSTSVVDYERIEAFRVYPNPAGDWLYIMDDAKHALTGARLYNLSGQVVGIYMPTDIEAGIFISDLQRGIYILEAEYNDGFRIQRKIIRR